MREFCQRSEYSLHSSPIILLLHGWQTISFLDSPMPKPSVCMTVLLLLLYTLCSTSISTHRRTPIHRIRSNTREEEEKNACTRFLFVWELQSQVTVPGARTENFRDSIEPNISHIKSYLVGASSSKLHPFFKINVFDLQIEHLQSFKLQIHNTYENRRKTKQKCFALIIFFSNFSKIEKKHRKDIKSVVTC